MFDRHATKVYAWATLGEGIVCGKVPERSGSAKCWCTAVNKERIVRLEQMAIAKGTSVASLAIAYALHGVDSAVVGCRSVEHFQDAARASVLKLSARELAYLRCEE